MDKTVPQKKKRIVWIDGMRALGILFVFFAHDGLTGGPMLLQISYVCSVPLFFFAAGLFARRSAQQLFVRYAADRCRQILLPYAVYGITTLLICALLDPSIFARLGAELLSFLLGRRNFLFAAATWFLPCLFVLSCLYQLMLRSIPGSWLRLAVSAVISLTARLFLEEPMLVFSANAALRYLFYYALGDALAPLLTAEESRRQTVLRLGLGCTGSLVFFAFAAGGLYNALLRSAQSSVPLTVALNIVFALSSIAAAALLGVLVGHIPPIAYLGRSTLICCGTESLARPLLAQLLSLFGIGLAPGTAVGRIAVNLLVLAFITVFFALPIQRFAPWLAGRKYSPRSKSN